MYLPLVKKKMSFVVCCNEKSNRKISCAFLEQVTLTFQAAAHLKCVSGRIRYLDIC